ncbi:MAG: NYN domain-containing protein [Candidatus Vogelbacteria bacterium]|nr:NYN domain-containing protein [Candidatus Vogelbacteria bacterium]
MKGENNYAFIDSQNLNLSIRDLGWKLDFARFRVYLKDCFGIDKAYLFIGFVNDNQSLYTYLQKAGYLLVFKPTLKLPDETDKGHVDAELVLHAMIEYLNYDKAVIVSGDGDFHCLVEYLKEKDKLKRLVIPNKHRFSSLLRKFAVDTTFLNGTKDKIGKDWRKTKEA